MPSLPARSCTEIKANKGGQAVSGSSRLDATGSGKVILAYCDVSTEGLIISFYISFYNCDVVTSTECFHF